MKRRDALAVALLAAAACSSDPPRVAEPSAMEPVAVSVEVVQEASAPETIVITGVVRPRRTATIAAQVMAQVRDVVVEESQRVTAGQTLINLDDRQLHARVQAADAMRDEAEAATAASAQAVRAAEARLALAIATHERFETLLSKESASQHEYDVAEAGRRAAEADLEQARAQQTQAEAQRGQAEAETATARTILGFARIAAPIPGIVSQRHVDPGDLAIPGLPLLEIEGAAYRLEAPIPASMITTVRVGQEVGVSIEALGADGPHTGRIAQIEPSSDDESRTFLAKIALSPSGGLRAGLYGQVSLLSGERSVRTVSPSAVVERGQIRSVYVAAGGVAQRRLVTLGGSVEGRYEVLSGLGVGERVILDPGELADGSSIEERR